MKNSTTTLSLLSLLFLFVIGCAKDTEIGPQIQPERSANAPEPNFPVDMTKPNAQTIRWDRRQVYSHPVWIKSDEKGSPTWDAVFQVEVPPVYDDCQPELLHHAFHLYINGEVNDADLEVQISSKYDNSKTAIYNQSSIRKANDCWTMLTMYFPPNWNNKVTDSFSVHIKNPGLNLTEYHGTESPFMASIIVIDVDQDGGGGVARSSN